MSLLAVDCLSFYCPGGSTRREWGEGRGVGAEGDRYRVPDCRAESSQQGVCRVQVRNAYRLGRAEVSRMVAHVPRTIPVDTPFPVPEVVLTGGILFGRGSSENSDGYASFELATRRARMEPFRARRCWRRY